jgi:hypothetical protein
MNKTVEVTRKDGSLKEVYESDTYHVEAIRHKGDVRQILIRRHDWQPLADWRDKQAIKNQIAGAESEAIELYPAESRLSDNGNWSHLWLQPGGAKFPYGYSEGSRLTQGEGQRREGEMSDTSLLRPVKKQKVFIAIPIYASVPGDFLDPLMEIAENLGKHMAFEIHTLTGASLVPVARNILSADFLQSDCTDILWIDSDILFTVNNVLRILSHDEAIISGCYATKDQHAQGIRFAGSALSEPPPPMGERGLFELRHAPAGFLRVQRQVFERMIESFGKEIAYSIHSNAKEGLLDYDFWRVGVKDGKYLTEDYYFCEQARRLGYRIFADTSILLGHIGSAVYPLTYQCEQF